MEKMTQLYEGKAKKVYATEDPAVVIVSYKDDATALDGLKKGTIAGKGVVNNRMTNFLMQLLEKNGVPTHFVEELNDRETAVKKVSIVPLEVIIRNVSAGHFAQRYGVEEGIVFDEPTIEFSYKNDALGDPLLNTYHALALKLATAEEIETIKNYAFAVNKVLKAFWAECGVTLVDFSFDIDGHMPFVEAVSGDNAAETVRLPRLADTKYLRGVTGLITGSERYPGAAVLSCKAAAKTNIGMIRYMGPQVCRDMVLDAVPEAVLGKGRVQAWVVGSGVPTGETEDDDFQRETIAKLLTHYALSSDDDPDDDDDLAYDMPPLVVDAGALDLLPDEVPPQVVITPHAGELASLLTARGEDVDASDVQNEPLHWALRAHELTGATVLLKGAVTIVVGEPADTDRESDAQGGFADDEQHVRVVVSGRAPAWLGTAGAGDVLAGMLGALLAQQDDEDVSAPDVAACAAYLHGYAAAQASQSDQRGFTPPTIYGSDDRHLRTKLGHPIVASDVIGMIPATFAELLS